VTSSLIAGVDIKTVSREAGHSKVAFTMDVYGHVLDEMHDMAASKRELLLKSRSAK
jgi:integrase